MREGNVDAVHVTICYHEGFVETVENIIEWKKQFEANSDLIIQGTSVKDIDNAKKHGKTAIFFGFQNCSPIESNIGLVEIVHELGVRFMQLTYNNQSLLATGCYEKEDSGITRMGREVIQEMNRVGLVIDMSHSGEKSTLEAIDLSSRPIAITHANPVQWHDALRNKSNNVLSALSESGGLLGFSTYSHHLKNGNDCSLESFCQMIAETAELVGVNQIGIGSDLCQNQPDSVVEWMRNGSWSKVVDYGEGSSRSSGFPDQPKWFRDNRDFINLRSGLKSVGFADRDISAIMGNNWYEFFKESFASN
tara:strand:- start:23 stop:940 length:918 start_codon:yes stop_codon:yes gene_type:complete